MKDRARVSPRRPGGRNTVASDQWQKMGKFRLRNIARRLAAWQRERTTTRGNNSGNVDVVERKVRDVIVTWRGSLIAIIETLELAYESRYTETSKCYLT